MSKEIVVYETNGAWIVRDDPYAAENKPFIYEGVPLSDEELIALAKIAGVARIRDCRRKPAGKTETLTYYDWDQL